MKVFTIKNGVVSEGVVVEKVAIKGGIVAIPAVVIGGNNPGRNRVVIPAQLINGQYKELQKNGRVRILFAEMGESRKKKPKIFAKEFIGSGKSVICVIDDGIDFHGRIDRTGIQVVGESINIDNLGDRKARYSEFPGEVIVAALNGQAIAVIPANSMFRVSSKPDAGDERSAYYYWNGWDLVAQSDIFL